SEGRIIAGQGTTTVRVDTTGLEGHTIRATLSMNGYPMDCSETSVLQLPIPVQAHKFDEFPAVTRNDEKARLDNFAIELQNDPTATAYVVIYPGQRGAAGDVQCHKSRIVDYLVNTRRIDNRRIITLVGPTRPELLIELWTAPHGTKPPLPR